MSKNKLYRFVIFTSLVFVLSFGICASAKADDAMLPDNVKITTSPDGTSTTVVINSKPGYSTSVETNCVNGKCTNTSTATKITDADIQKMQANMQTQQEEMQQFFQMQQELFVQQQKMFQDLWGINLQ